MYREIQKNLEKWQSEDRRKPLIVKGARQVGKTFTLLDWGKKAFPQVHYINFEKSPQAVQIFVQDFDVKRIIMELSFWLKTFIDPQRDLLIFDEIQAAPRALTALKYFCEDMPQLAICSAGSLLGVILSEESFPVGKVSFLHLYPLNFSEFLEAVDERESAKWLPPPSLTAKIPLVMHDHLWEMLKLYYVVGGMPEAVEKFRQLQNNLHEALLQVRVVQRDLLQTYENDFAKHSGKLNAIHIQALYRNIPSQLAEAHDDSVQRFKFGDVMPGKKGFSAWERPLHWLVNAGLTLQTKIANTAEMPIEHYCKPNQFKLYLHDIGLLGCAQRLEPAIIRQEQYGLAKGYFAENFVAQELRASHYDQEWPLYGWSERSSEIEFIRIYQGRIIPIEVKSGRRTQAKSLMQFQQQYRPPLAIKISANSLQYRHEEQLLLLPLYLAAWGALLN